MGGGGGDESLRPRDSLEGDSIGSSERGACEAACWVKMRLKLKVVRRGGEELSSGAGGVRVEGVARGRFALVLPRGRRIGSWARAREVVRDLGRLLLRLFLVLRSFSSPVEERSAHGEERVGGEREKGKGARGEDHFVGSSCRSWVAVHEKVSFFAKGWWRRLRLK